MTSIFLQHPGFGAMLLVMRRGSAIRARVAVRLAAALIIATSAAGAPADAQVNSAEIAGVVRDVSGAVLSGALVTIAQPSTGLVVQRTTDAEGRFFAPALAIGVWTVTVAFPGLASETRRVVLEVGRTVQLEFGLVVAGLAEEVSVDSAATLLQGGTAEISDVIENEQVVQLPINGRQFLSLAQLSDRRVLAVFSDWRINAVVTLQSGSPFTVSLGVDRANIGAGPEQRPDQLRDPICRLVNEQPIAGSIPAHSPCRRRSRLGVRRGTA
jgi:Carboxypeptidase regulatory-like domain